MPLVKKLVKIGASRAVVLPKAFLEQLSVGDDPQAEVELTLEGGRISIAPHRYATDQEVQVVVAQMKTKHRKALLKLED